MSAAVDYNDCQELEPLKPHITQYRAFNDPKRFKVVPAGRRSGKTELAKRKILSRITVARKKHTVACQAWRRRLWVERNSSLPDDQCTCPYYPPPYRYFVGAPTHDQAYRIYWDWFKAHIPTSIVSNINESKRIIEVRVPCEGNFLKAELHVLGLDKPERVEGPHWDGCVLDEYANMKERTWPAHVRPALSDRLGWAWLIGVPEARNHYYDTFQAAKTGNRGWGAYTWTSATVLPASEVEAARRDLDERTFRQEYEASFEEAHGAVYYAFKPMKDVHDFEVPDDVTPWIGVDFNVGLMAAVVGHERMLSDGHVHTFVTHSYEVNTTSTYDLADHLKAQGHFPATCYPDPSGRARHTVAPEGVTDHEILRQAGFEVLHREYNPFVRNRVNAVNTRFCTGDGRRRMHIHPRCKPLIKALNSQLYDDKGEPDKKGGYDHLVDALGYPIELMHPIRNEDAIGGIQF